MQLFNAFAGSNRLLSGGNNVAPADSATPGDFLHLHPRTAAGIAPGNRLLLATIDGRRSGFSEGMYLREVADLLKSYGATEAINLDGGGSTTMTIDHYADGARRSQLVNTPSGSERYNGASLAVFAARNPTFIPPGGVVNVLTGRKRELSPVLAAHMDVNALDLAGAADDAAELERLAADNVKRVVRDGADGQSPWHAAAFLELKTVWHPIGV